MPRTVSFEVVPATSLVMDHNRYPRTGVSDRDISRIVEALESGLGMPPIIADKATRRVVDGFHRLIGYMRRYGEDVQVEVEWREYDSELDFFLDCARTDAAHGRKLSRQDQRMVALRVLELGGDWTDAAHSLNTTAERLQERMLVAELAEPREVGGLAEPIRGNGRSKIKVPLKRTLQHLDGRRLTEAQAAANDRAGGMPVIFYIQQVAMLLESDAIDLDDPAISGALTALARLIGEKLP